MSYILEALRKAEQERSLGRIPDLETVYAQLPSPRRRRIWLWLLLALVLIGNTITLVMLVPQQESHQTGLLSAPATTIPRPVPSAAQVPPDVSSPSPQTVATQTQKLAPSAENQFSMTRPSASLHQPESLSEDSSSGDVTASSSVAVASPPQLQKPKPPPSSAKANDTKDTTLSSPIALSEPTVLSELPEALQRTIPTLNLDIHVYHAMPGRSFVVINSRRYQAGDTLHEGPFLERITADGVVLAQQGNRFLLPVHH